MKFYYYFFYQLYKFWEYVSVPKFWSDWKAGLSIIILELWGYIAILNLYDIINNISTDSSLTNPIVLIPFLIIVIINYIVFIHYDNKWIMYNDQFDNLPKRKKRIGNIIVWIVIFSIIIIYFSSTFYLHKLVYGEY